MTERLNCTEHWVSNRISGCPDNGVLITEDLRKEGKPSPLFQSSENTTTYIFKYDYENTCCCCC